MTREAADASRVRAFIESLGERSKATATIYLVGGTSAVLKAWRPTTRDIDMRVEPESATGTIGDAIVDIKRDLGISVEFSSPMDFLPELPGWRDRSPFVEQVGPLTFRHFDFYGQALAKVRRGIDHDAGDVAAMIRDELVEPARAWGFYDEIRTDFRRFPSIDEPSFEARMTVAFGPRP